MIAVAEVRINMVMRSLSEPLGTRRRQKAKSKVKQRFVNKFIVQISTLLFRYQHRYKVLRKREG